MKTHYNKPLLLIEIESGLRLAAHVFAETGRLMSFSAIKREYRELSEVGNG